MSTPKLKRGRPKNKPVIYAHDKGYSSTKRSHQAAYYLHNCAKKYGHEQTTSDHETCVGYSLGIIGQNQNHNIFHTTSNTVASPNNIHPNSTSTAVSTPNNINHNIFHGSSTSTTTLSQVAETPIPPQNQIVHLPTLASGVQKHLLCVKCVR